MTILSGLDGMVLEICLVLGDNRWVAAANLR